MLCSPFAQDNRNKNQTPRISCAASTDGDGGEPGAGNQRFARHVMKSDGDQVPISSGIKETQTGSCESRADEQRQNRMIARAPHSAAQRCRQRPLGGCLVSYYFTWS